MLKPTFSSPPSGARKHRTEPAIASIPGGAIFTIPSVPSSAISEVRIRLLILTKS